jgi:hypothetical protein
MLRYQAATDCTYLPLSRGRGRPSSRAENLKLLYSTLSEYTGEQFWMAKRSLVAGHCLIG